MSVILYPRKLIPSYHLSIINIHNYSCSVVQRPLSIFALDIIIAWAPLNHGYSLQLQKQSQFYQFSIIYKCTREVGIPTKFCREMLPLEAVLLFWLLSCNTVGVFDTIKELCSPSNSCEQQDQQGMKTLICLKNNCQEQDNKKKRFTMPSSYD